MNEQIKKGAIISSTGLYRYQLWRIWDESKPNALFLLHNPSTADADTDDPTVRRCTGFAKSWDYGGIYIVNLYPYRATNPKELLGKEFIDVASPLANLEYIRDAREKCSLLVVAYGNPIVMKADYFDTENFKECWMCFGLTREGNPKHPLYLRKNTPLRTVERALKDRWKAI